MYSRTLPSALCCDYTKNIPLHKFLIIILKSMIVPKKHCNAGAYFPENLTA